MWVTYFHFFHVCVEHEHVEKCKKLLNKEHETLSLHLKLNKMVTIISRHQNQPTFCGVFTNLESFISKS